MNDYIWRILFVLIPSFLALIYGIGRVFPRTHGLYFRMPTMAVACLFMAHLSYFTLIITGNSFDTEVNIGLLGGLGSALFFCTQNTNPVSSIYYDPKNDNSKSRHFPWIAPIVIMVTYVVTEIGWYCQCDTFGFSYWIGIVGSFGLISAINARTAFTTLRFALVPDEKFGFVSCVRPYNIVLTCFLILTTVEKYIRYLWVSSVIEWILMLLFYIVFAVNILLLLPLQERGRVKFLTSL